MQFGLLIDALLTSATVTGGKLIHFRRTIPRRSEETFYNRLGSCTALQDLNEYEESGKVLKDIGFPDIVIPRDNRCANWPHIREVLVTARLESEQGPTIKYWAFGRQLRPPFNIDIN